MKYLFLIFLLSFNCFAQIEVVTQIGTDFEMGQGEKQNSGNHLYKHKTNEGFGLGLNLRTTDFRFVVRYEDLNSTHKYKDVNGSTISDLSSDLKLYSVGFDYFPNLPNFKPLYLLIRAGSGEIKVKAKNTNSNDDQRITLVSAGAGVHLSIAAGFFVYGELMLRKVFMDNVKVNGFEHSNHSFMPEYSPRLNIGLGYSF